MEWFWVKTWRKWERKTCEYTGKEQAPGSEEIQSLKFVKREYVWYNWRIAKINVVGTDEQGTE